MPSVPDGETLASIVFAYILPITADCFRQFIPYGSGRSSRTFLSCANEIPILSS